MLEELHVRDLALIEDAWLDLGPGMTVLTGETGAGKTVLVGALKLLIGERADSALVRAGASEALVEGRFTLDGVERTARRRIAADGRSRCYIDEGMSTVGGLADAFGPAVDLHGQHDHQELLRPASHAALFDRFAGAGPALESYRAAFRGHGEAAEALRAAEESMTDRGRRIAGLRALIDDVDTVAPEPGEDDAIAASLPRLRHAERLMSAAASAYQALAGDGSADSRFDEAAAALGRVSGLDPALDSLARELGDLEDTLRSLATRVRDYGESTSHDPVALEEAEARLAALTVLKRSYGPDLADVLTAWEAAASEVEVLEAGEQGLDRLRHAVEETEAALVGAADELAAVRDAATADFESRLADAARDLAMPSARFEVSLRRLPRDSWTSSGPQAVEFLVASSAGEDARPLARTASGGEVSRVMLALKSVLGHADTVPILVFDEIDAGIGGATATAVGARLRSLAEGRQVLVITHLAQVAAFADAHLVVEKEDRDGRAHTSVRTVSGEERVAEVARMLSGSSSDVSLDHARELLASVAGRAV